MKFHTTLFRFRRKGGNGCVSIFMLLVTDCDIVSLKIYLQNNGKTDRTLYLTAKVRSVIAESLDRLNQDIFLTLMAYHIPPSLHCPSNLKNTIHNHL